MLNNSRIFIVDNEFPALTIENISNGIISAEYSISLSYICGSSKQIFIGLIDVDFGK